MSDLAVPEADPRDAGSGVGPVLVIGGTGTTGRRLAARLLQRGVRVRTASRHPHTSPADGSVPVVFDWHDPATYPGALDGADRLYLLRPSGPSAGALPPVERFLAAAGHAGVRRVVLLHSTVTGPVGMPEIPEAVREAVPEWAILQPSWFMQNFTGDHPTARSIRERGEIVTATADGRVGFIDADDIAAVAAEALLAADAPNADHVLTGPEALSHTQVAAIISEVSGRPVRHVNLTAEEITARWIAVGLPESSARIAADLDAAISHGEQDFTTSTVEKLTGRPPRSFRDHARRAAWA